MTSKPRANYSTDAISGMPSAEIYRQILTTAPAHVRESGGRTGFAFSERHLQCVWMDANLRPTSLTTRDGEALSVVDPGRWNLEAGPDFLDAEIS